MRHSFVPLLLLTALTACEPETEGNSIQIDIEIVGQGTVTATGRDACSADCEREFYLDESGDGTPPVTQINLAAIPAPGWRFSHWEPFTEKFGRTIPNVCSNGTDTVSVISLDLVTAEQVDGFFEYGCRAVFVMDGAGGDGYAASASMPNDDEGSPGGLTYGALEDFLAFCGEQPAAQKTDGYDGYVTIFVEEETTEVKMPGVAPRTCDAAGDGSIALGGFAAAGFDCWLGILDGDALTLQETLGGDCDDLYQIVVHDDGAMTAAGDLTADGSTFVADLAADGTVSAVTRLDADAIPSLLTPLSDGGVIVGMTRYLGATTEVDLVRLASDRTIAWQTVLSGGAIDIDGVTELDDGGLLAWGSQGADFASANGLLIALDLDGAIDWQRTYGAGGDVDFRGAFASGNGFRAVGNLANVGSLVLDLDATGAVTEARALRDASGVSGGFLVGAFARAGGGVMFGRVDIGAGSMHALATAADLTVADCDEPSTGIVAETPTVPSAAATATAAAGALVASSVATFPTTPTTILAIPGAAVRTDACSE